MSEMNQNRTINANTAKPFVGDPKFDLGHSNTRVCCGELIQPRLAEVRDKTGEHLYFGTVWVCPHCRKVTR